MEKLSIIVAGPEYPLTRVALEILNFTAQISEAEVLILGQNFSQGIVDNIANIGSMRYIPQDNASIAAAYNYGRRLAHGELLLFMHTDVLLYPWALDEMRCALLMPDASLGAVMPMSSSRAFGIAGAERERGYTSIRELAGYVEHFAENKPDVTCATMFLEGFCMLARAAAMQDMEFDTSYHTDLFSAVDMGMRLTERGIGFAVADGAYVHCESAASHDYVTYNERDAALFRDKWKFDAKYSGNIRIDFLQWMDVRAGGAALDIGCACGGNLKWLKSANPAMECYGIELNEAAARVASSFGEVLCADIEQFECYSWHNKFDYIIMGDVIEHLRRPELALAKVRAWLKPGGHLVLGTPNIMHWSVLAGLLLEGDFRYEAAGILDRTHLKFFTRKSLVRMLAEAGYEVVDWNNITIPADAEHSRFSAELMRISSEQVTDEDIDTYQWQLLARKCNN